MPEFAALLQGFSYIWHCISFKEDYTRNFPVHLNFTTEKDPKKILIFHPSSATCMELPVTPQQFKYDTIEMRQQNGQCTAVSVNNLQQNNIDN